MPHSLRAKIKGLRYKGIITDKDCDRLRKALDNEDVLDKIRSEIEQITDTMGVSYNQYVSKIDVLQIIDKHMAKEGKE